MSVTILVAGCLCHPDQTFFYFDFPPSIVFTQHRDGGICDDKWVWPLAFVCRYHVADQNTHIQFFVALLMILPQTGNHYWIHLRLEVSGHHQTKNDVLQKTHLEHASGMIYRYHVQLPRARFRDDILLSRSITQSTLQGWYIVITFNYLQHPSRMTYCYHDQLP